MSFFTILGAATGDLFAGIMADRMREPAKPADTAKPAENKRALAALPVQQAAPPQEPAPLKSYRTPMGDRAYY